MRTMQAVGQEFYTELLRHHFGCEWSEQNSSLISTDEETQRANPFQVAGARFEAELLRRFHHDRSFEVVDQPGQEKFEEQ